MPDFSDAHDDYRRDGYAIVRGFFSSNEIAEIGAAFDQVHAEGVAHASSFRHGNLFYNVATGADGAPIVRMTQWPSYHQPVLNAVRQDPRFAELFADWLGGEAKPDDAFRAGVRLGLRGGALTADLFSVRARILLGQAKADDAPSFTSGLLIGNDVRCGLAEGDGPVTVIGRPELTRLYAAAIEVAGRLASQVDGERAFLAGIIEIARKLQ